MSKIIFSESDTEFMERAILISIQNVEAGGGPFGAVIVKDGRILSEGVNTVTRNNDPTAHAEVNAIRAACHKLKTFRLTGCTIYTSCEPCPMCLSAIYWSGISRIFFGNTKEDAKAIDFDDSFIYEEIKQPYAARSVPAIPFMREKAQKAFTLWGLKDDKIEY